MISAGLKLQIQKYVFHIIFIRVYYKGFVILLFFKIIIYILLIHEHLEQIKFFFFFWNGPYMLLYLWT